MDISESKWSKDSQSRVDHALQALGFASLTQFLVSNPAKPYGEIATQIGNVAPILLIARQFREARLAGNIRDAAKDSLCRNLVEQLPNGWQIGDNAQWQTVRALSAWTTELQVTGECHGLRQTLMKIANCLRELPPPTGWIPTGTDDPVIAAAFEEGWSSDAPE